ncbi:hypothetical protein ASD19_02465 [Microbacterium sp. Root53]|uniref:DUF4190 domain-containing protein n=1 Tax=Microbacterium sp. Root53 TaxID=1736553 RepID=UPI0006FCD444|nr:DUF4190 domain-containing protein [Microbacterium sp. Root53]KQZ04905.1 hypothetical protein ASD19_02465 [Microbacterium sp. Root53]
MSLPPNHDDGATPESPTPPTPPAPPAPADDDAPQFQAPTTQTSIPEYTLPPAPVPDPEFTVPPAPPAPAGGPPPPPAGSPEAASAASLGASFPGAPQPGTTPADQGYPAPAPLPPYAAAQPQGYPGAPGAGHPGGQPGPGYPGSGYPGAPYGGAPYGGVPVAPPSAPGKGLAITALVLGILGFLGALIPFGIFVAGLLLLAAVVIGIIVLVRRMPGKGLGIAGLVLGVIGLIAGTVSTIATVSFLTTQVPTIIQEECENQGLSPEECEALMQGGGTDGDPSGAPADPGVDAVPIAIGTPFEVPMVEGTAQVTVNSVTTSADALPGTDITPVNGSSC